MTRLELVQYLERTARYGDRIVVNGKTWWAGLGNRAGLHHYAETVLSDKWRKSGPNFVKRINNLQHGDKVEVQAFRNITRDRGRWRTIRQLVA